MLSDEEEQLLSHAIGFLSDNFPNFGVVVLSKENELLHADYSSWRVGRMLFRDALEEMQQDMELIRDMDGWEDYDEGDFEDE